MKKIIILITVTFLLISCSGEIKDVSYKEDVEPIINEYCLDCHNSDQNLGGLNFESYTKLMESRYLNRAQSLVIPGDASQSRLYLVVHSTDKLIRMPPENFGYDRLSDSEIEIIKVWIDEGAKDN